MFCPACATAVEPGAATCPNCGEALQIVPAVPIPQEAPPVSAPSQPPAVRTAGTLLWLSLAIGVLTSLVSIAALAGRVRSLLFAVPLILFPILWAVVIFFTMRRNNVARFAVILLVAYAAFNLLFRFRLLILGANPGAIVSLIELGLRAYAVYLLLRPESNAWYSGRQA